MEKYIIDFLENKPIFFSFLRPKEVFLYQKYKPFNAPILDIGCGDGFFAKIAFGRIDIGLDVKNSEINEAKEKKVYKKIVIYDGKKIPFPDNYFSTIICNSSFEHIPNIDEVLKESARVLKKNGNMYFTVPTNIWPKYLFGIKLFGSIYSNFFIKKSKHYNLYSLKKWTSVLNLLGYKVKYSTHYLDNKKIIGLFDMSHYLSISSIITKLIFNRWVLFPQKTIFLKSLVKFISQNTSKNTKKGPYLFIAARKIK